MKNFWLKEEPEYWDKTFEVENKVTPQVFTFQDYEMTTIEMNIPYEKAEFFISNLQSTYHTLDYEKRVSSAVAKAFTKEELLEFQQEIGFESEVLNLALSIKSKDEAIYLADKLQKDLIYKSASLRDAVFKEVSEKIEKEIADVFWTACNVEKGDVETLPGANNLDCFNLDLVHHDDEFDKCFNINFEIKAAKEQLKFLENTREALLKAHPYLTNYNNKLNQKENG